jgi:hypothetical protein
MVAHPDLKKAAGDQFFKAHFLPQGGQGVFKTDIDAVADVLVALIGAGKLKGVQEVTAESEAPGAAQSSEVTTNGNPNPRRGQQR